MIASDLFKPEHSPGIDPTYSTQTFYWTWTLMLSQFKVVWFDEM